MHRQRWQKVNLYHSRKVVDHNIAQEKSLITRRELQITSGSNYKIHNDVISYFNQQE